MLLFNYLHLLFNSFAFQIHFILPCPVRVNAHITNIMHFSLNIQPSLAPLSQLIYFLKYVFIHSWIIYIIFTWQQGFWSPYNEGCLTPVLSGHKLRLTDVQILYLRDCLCLLSLVWPINKNDESMWRNPWKSQASRKVTPGNNWDGTTCGSLWGVESNPNYPELWIPEVRWNW